VCRADILGQVKKKEKDGLVVGGRNELSRRGEDAIFWTGKIMAKKPPLQPDRSGPIHGGKASCHTCGLQHE